MNLFDWIHLKFTRHEAWAIKSARRVPLLAIFAVVTLWLWVLLPMIPISILSVYLLQEMRALWDILSMFLGPVGLVVMFLWLARWYIICLGATKWRRQKKKRLRLGLKGSQTPKPRQTVLEVSRR